MLEDDVAAVVAAGLDDGDTGKNPGMGSRVFVDDVFISSHKPANTSGCFPEAEPRGAAVHVAASADVDVVATPPGAAPAGMVLDEDEGERSAMSSPGMPACEPADSTGPAIAAFSLKHTCTDCGADRVTICTRAVEMEVDSSLCWATSQGAAMG